MDNEQENDFLDNEEELDDLGESAGAESTDDAPPATDNDGSETESKRIRDLMSRADKAEARANQLEAQLKGKGSTKRSKDKAETDEFMELVREQSRNQLFSSDPRLAEYGLKPSVIAGNTPEEMRASFDQYKSLLDAIVSKVRNQVLVEHGLDAGVTGSGKGQELPDFSAMPAKDFKALMDRRSNF